MPLALLKEYDNQTDILTGKCLKNGTIFNKYDVLIIKKQFKIL